MAVLQTGQSFASGNQVTATKLQDIANLATFRTGTNQTADDSTIQVDGSGGYLKVKSLGITSNELATDSVITAKIQNGAVTSDKLDATAISVLMPSGTILPYSGANAPGATSPIADYLICDGRSLNTYDYRDLHAVISDTYGGTAYNPGTTDQAGASTEFNIPDIRGRVIAGLDVLQGTRSNRLTTTSAANIDGQTLGANNGNPNDTGRGTNGAQEHQLIEAEMPSHNHSYNVAQVGTGVAGGGSQYCFGVTGATTGLKGSDQAHNNVQPTIILNYIIKT
jgi:microcystin-dependent protein